MADNLTHPDDSVFANALTVSCGVLGCLLNVALGAVVVCNSTRGYYRTLILAMAIVDFCFAISCSLISTWFYMIDGVVYCVDYGVSTGFPYWLSVVVWATTFAAFYLQLMIITWSFVWRAMLISLSGNVRYIETNIIFVLFTILALAVTYNDFGVECYAEHSAYELTFLLLLPSITCSVQFIVIGICVCYIIHKLQKGTMSKQLRSTHSRRLLVLCVQVINPLVLNFATSTIFTLGLVAPIPEFLVSFIPYEILHPILNALIVLILTTEHRRFLRRLFIREASSSTLIIVSAQ